VFIVTRQQLKNGVLWKQSVAAVKVKGEVKLSLCLTKSHATKMYYWGSGGIAPHILDCGTRWR